MAWAALHELRDVFPDTADSIEADLVGSNLAIPSWEPPLTQADQDGNHGPLSIGQLKAVADPFYHHLDVVAPTWLAEQRASNLTEFGGIYPWTQDPSDDNNSAIANIGQLKAVFALHFETMYDHDADGDYLPDWWEVANGLSPYDSTGVNGGSGDPDGDGVSNSGEYSASTSPQDGNDFPVQMMVIERQAWSAQAGLGWTRLRSASWEEGQDTNEVVYEILTPAMLVDKAAMYTFPEDPPSGFDWSGSPWGSELVNGITTDARINHTGYPTGSVTDQRIWLKAPVASHERRFSAIKVVEENVLPGGVGPGNYTVESAEIVDFVIPANGQYSGHEDSMPIPIDVEGSSTITRASIYPVEVAPEVLAVNSDFDEGRIDPNTGYAIPDCDDIPDVDAKTGDGNTLMALEAVRDHLDGEYAQTERITDDMHEGWFGVNPHLLGDDFWDGATVTIRKLDKDDPDSGRKESGQVRFYAKWGDGDFEYYGIEPYNLDTLAAVNLAQGGISGKPGESVYGSGSNIPGNSKFYIEGVRPGKITLEWRLQKGDIDIKHEQTFLVATQQSKQKWIDQVYYQVKLQSTELMDELVGSPVLEVYPIDMNRFDPKNGFFKNSQNHNYAYIQRVYYYYQQLFKQSPEELYWAGMAKTAGASVYAGMGDMHIWWHTPWPLTPDAVTRGRLDKVLDDFLVTGNKNIFRDMAWAHHAYVSSGIWALRHIEENFGDGEEPITDFVAWENIDAGIRDGDSTKLSSGNRDVLFREQSVVMPPLYDQMKLVWVKPHSLQWLQETFSGFVAPSTNANGEINMDEAFSLNAQNPIDKDTGPMFRDLVPNGSLSDFNDRWAWIEDPQEGMLQIWMGTATATPAFDAEKRANFNGLQFYAHAIQYSMSNELPPE